MGLLDNVKNSPFVAEMVKATANMYRLGWDERNGGNISLMVDEEEVIQYVYPEKVIRTIPTGFDASINRLSAWVTGQRSMEKALLMALLTPNAQLKALQDEGNFTELMVRTEEYKMLPVYAVWKEYLSRVGVKEDYFSVIKEYEKNVLSAR